MKPTIQQSPRDRHGKLKTVAQILFLIFLIAGTVWILVRHSNEKLQTSQGPVYGTFYKIQYLYSEPLDSLIRRELMRVDASLSMFNPSSTVSRINKNESTETDSLFRYVYRLACRVSSQTGGAYDVTVAPLVNAWGFGTTLRDSVSVETIDSLKEFVGYDKTRLKGTQFQKDDPRMQLDFSSIAKGYGVDLVARLFDSLNIKNYMIEVGGEVVVKGLHPEGRPWVIGITKPSEIKDGGPEEIFQTLSITDVAMATSGNYRRFYERDGKRYAHTIDPVSGYPVQHSLLSATVFAPDCATADAYATAFMVLGLDKARQILEQNKDLYAYFIYSDHDGQYKVWYSPQLEKYLQK